MEPISEDSEDSLSKPMSLRYLPPPSPALSVSSYAHQAYIPDRYLAPGPDRPSQDQHAFDPPFVHDYRAYNMGHSYERPQALSSQDALRPGLSRAHPDSPGSPMQLDFILNDPKPLSPSSPSPLQTTQDSEEPSPREPTRPQQPSETESSPPPPPPPTLPQENKPVHSTRSTTARQTITKFEAITAHTAKCDLCNRRNDAGMSRCLSCGWQSCHSCTLKNGCTRTHKAGSRAHTGPIDNRELVSGSTTGDAAAATAPRGRKKARGRGKSRGRGGSKSRSRMGREGEDHDRDGSPTTLVGVDVGAGAADAGHVSSPVEQASSSPGIDSSQGRDMMVEGARNLYAFSLEAYMSWTREQKGKEKEDPNSEWRTFAGIEDFHSYAQEEANRVFGQYSQDG